LFFSGQRLFALLLAGVLILQLFTPGSVWAAEKENTGENAEAKITLEQAIRIVKENFQVPPEFEDFSSGFDNNGQQQVWSLNWNSPQATGGNFRAQVDAVSGEIVNIYLWKSANDADNTYKLPSLTVDQAKTIADAIVQKLAGPKYPRLKFKEENKIIPLNLYGGTSYAFSWQRIENDIPVMGNGVSVQVNADSGEVMSYAMTWNEIDFPQPAATIDVASANETFHNAKMLELQYFLPPIFRIAAADGKEQVQLVYALQKNGMIDALTGKPLTLNANQWLAENSALVKGGFGAADKASAGAVPLTPQELKEIDQNAKLLTKEQGIEAVKRWLDIPADLPLRSMNLNTDPSSGDQKVWSYEWASNDPKQGRDISARVNALTGDLLSFNDYAAPVLSSPGGTEKSVPLSQEQARQLAEDFLRKIQPEKFQQVQLNSENSPEVKPVSVVNPANPVNPVSFSYERVVNGLPFAANGMNIAVDVLTQKVTSYSLNWRALDFPSLSQALPQTEIERIFLQARPLSLQYVLVYNQGEPTEAKLVYQPAEDNPSVSNLLDAKNGVFLNALGNPMGKQAEAIRFTDIAGNEAEQEITALGQAGIFGEYGNQFKPEEALTAVSLCRALLMARNGSADTQDLSDTDILKKAKEQGLLKEEIAPTQAVSRELLSKILVRSLGLVKIAEIQGIYGLAYEDARDLPASTQGYIALISGLGIMKPAGSKFEPTRTVTRAEAATAIIRTLGLRLS
jgi:hypothetical protein